MMKIRDIEKALYIALSNQIENEIEIVFIFCFCEGFSYISSILVKREHAVEWNICSGDIKDAGTSINDCK